MNSNSSGSSGSPLSLSSHLRDSSDALSRPTWLFNSQGRPARLFVQAGKERTRSPVEKNALVQLQWPPIRSRSGMRTKNMNSKHFEAILSHISITITFVCSNMFSLSPH
ncbi:unnamed protein product [Cylicocyclus nassatus]|uniref:Uncharacterized protein n=1 Tax=Cylicocyclus nassatus TaxID=53992 RepID=A0AA36GZ73_CYLNA|nr:unnamed protein product [Cylicocyclus nassatus]